MPKTQEVKKAKAPTLNEQGRFKAFFSNNLFIILAFLVPFVLMTTAFALMKVSPFGDQQILVTDLWHQYFPFLVDFQDKLKHGEPGQNADDFPQTSAAVVKCREDIYQ